MENLTPKLEAYQTHTDSNRTRGSNNTGLDPAELNGAEKEEESRFTEKNAPTNYPLDFQEN